jgi:hypothetical protein
MSMKSKILGITLLLVAGSASAQHFRHHGHHGHWVHSGGSNWVPALIAGGIVGVAIANSRQPETVIIQQPSVILRNPPVYVERQPVCTEWKEIQTTDGTIYRERTCTQ